MISGVCAKSAQYYAEQASMAIEARLADPEVEFEDGGESDTDKEHINENKSPPTLLDQA